MVLFAGLAPTPSSIIATLDRNLHCAMWRIWLLPILTAFIHGCHGFTLQRLPIQPPQPSISQPISYPGNELHKKNTNRRQSIILMGQRGKRIKKEIKKERQMETPPRIPTPYGPIRMMRPLSICETCHGRGVVRCNVS